MGLEPNQENILTRLRETIQDLDSDYTAESIVVALIEAGFPAEHIVVEPKGTSRRSYRKDVSDFHLEYPANDASTYLFLHSNRDGIYDSLPESIFHQAKEKGRMLNKPEMLDQMQRHREEEAYARKFFLPYEQEYHRVRQRLYALEEGFESMSDASMLVDVFKSFWPILDRFDVAHASIFLRMIPLLHVIRNDFDLVCESLCLLLDVPVEIVRFVQAGHEGLYPAIPLGEMLLGRDSVVGVRGYDGEGDVLLKVGPCEPVILEEFLPGAIKDGLIEALCDYFLSVHYEVKVEFVREQTTAGFAFDGSAVLGMGARI